MENVVRGFISPSGVMIRVARTGFENCNEVEMVAESICRNIERVSGSFDVCYQTYLVEVSGYVYVEWCEDSEVVQIEKPSVVTEAQQMVLMRIMGKSKGVQKLLRL